MRQAPTRGKYKRSIRARWSFKEINISDQSIIKFPDVIIAGAPKCGTTSVFEWLAAHHQVCGSSVKETYFLMDKDSPLYIRGSSYNDIGPVGYDKYFSHCKENSSLLVEATPDYLYQKTPLSVIANTHKPVKVVFILRKPSDRVYSTYRFFTGNKSIFDQHISFAEFIRTVKYQEGPTNHPLWPLIANAIRYSEYIRYLIEWEIALGRNNMAIYTYEEMLKSPARMMKNLSDMLCIDSEFYSDYDFPAHNQSYAVKSIKLHRLKTHVASLMPNSRLKARLGKLYSGLNTTAQSLPMEASDAKAMEGLDRHFSATNAELASHFNLDLSAWD
ncbi:MAG: sulfotransferase domain-containing protein [Pseudomonadota bacterium]